jgi:type II secretory pathway component PulK
MRNTGNINGEKGSALLLVTGICLVIGIVATFVFYRAEAEWAAVVGFENSDAMRKMAEEVLQERLTAFLNDRKEFNSWQDAWYAGGRTDDERNGYQITSIVEDEGSKLNLNLLNEAAFKILLDKGISPDPILDWKDLDSDQRPDGAENEYYQGLSPSYKARDGLFASLDELRQLKDGSRIYQSLASQVTVFGKLNPNARIERDTLIALLMARGFEKSRVEQMADNMITYSKSNEFASYDDFLKLPSVTLEIRDKLKPLFQFEGNMNINLVSRPALQALFLEITGADQPAWTAEIVGIRPFESMDTVKGFFEAKRLSDAKLPKNIGVHYFTITTKIVRYRIWVQKGTRKLFLETVQERLPADIKGEWKIHPLAWRILSDHNVPAIPAQPNQKNGGVSY